MGDKKPDFDRKRKKIKRVFAEKLEEFSIEASLDLDFIGRRPIADENVYGEAFPEEGRVKLDVFAPEATDEEIEWNICHELTHIKYLELDHDSEKFQRIVREHMEEQEV